MKVDGGSQTLPNPIMQKMLYLVALVWHKVAEIGPVIHICRIKVSLATFFSWYLSAEINEVGSAAFVKFSIQTTGRKMYAYKAFFTHLWHHTYGDMVPPALL